MIDQPLPISAALDGIDDAITLTREAAGEIGDDRRSQTLTRRHLDEALDWPRRQTPCRRVTRGLGGPVGGALDTRPNTVRRRCGAHRRARRGSRQRARDLGRGDPHGRRQPRSRPRCAATAHRFAGECNPSRPSPSSPTRRCARARRRIIGGRGHARPTTSRRSPTRPTGCSARWTSASCSIRPASCSRSGSGSTTARWTRATTTCSPRRPASTSFMAIAKGDVAAGPLVPARPRPDPCRPRLCTDLVVGIDVRVPHAGPGDARPRQQPPRPDQPAGRGSSDPVRRRARGAVGHLRIRVQRPRHRPDVPVLELRRARPRFEARPQRGCRRRPVRDGAGGDDPTRRPRCATSPGWPRRARAGGTASGRRSTTPPAGSPKGQRSRSSRATWPITRDGIGGARQRAARPGDGRPLPRRSDRRGDRTAAAGAHAAQRARGPATRRGGQERGRRSRSRAADPAPVQLAARRHPAHAPAVERAIRGDGDGGRIRLQPMARYGRHPLARGRHLRPLGQLSLRPRHVHRRRAVGRPPAERQGGRQLRGHLLGGSRRSSPVATVRW